MPGDLSRQPDDEYKEATKAVVDDAMRTDILGPRIVKIMQEHKPANDAVKEILNEAVTNDARTKTVLEKLLDDIATNRKGRWIERVLIPAAVAAFVAALVNRLLN